MNIHEEYEEKNKEHLKERFPLRKHNDRLLYLKQILIVFGSFILSLILLMRLKKWVVKSYTEVCGIEISLISCMINLLFAWGFGFVAVINDWWFFFPDLFSGYFWTIKNGHMVIDDAIFYVFATIMGHLAVVTSLRMKQISIPKRVDNYCKMFWFIILLFVIIFGLPFGSKVCQGMIWWLYLPFGLSAFLLYNRYNAIQLWLPTTVFVLCEFIWDVIARIQGVWIFPDAATHPGLYFQEITFFHIGKFPIIWQPEMTQMAFISGMICLTFFYMAKVFVQGDSFMQPVQKPS